MLLESFLFADKANPDWNRRWLLAQCHNCTVGAQNGNQLTSILI